MKGTFGVKCILTKLYFKRRIPVLGKSCAIIFYLAIPLAKLLTVLDVKHKATKTTAFIIINSYYVRLIISLVGELRE